MAMESQTDLKYRLSYRVVTLIGMAAFALLGFSYFFTYDQFDWKVPLYAAAMLLIPVFFVSSHGFGILTGSTVLSITDEGIHDSRPFVRHRFIPWKQMERVRAIYISRAGLYFEVVLVNQKVQRFPAGAWTIPPIEVAERMKFHMRDHFKTVYTEWTSLALSVWP